MLGGERVDDPIDVLEVQGLRTYFQSDEGIVKAVDGVDFTVNRNEALGIVGESGCGKSITALSIMRLIAGPAGKIAGGRIFFNGEDLLEKSEAEMRNIRGNQISMIFQEPMTSLNPVFTAGEQIAEAILLHQQAGKKDAMVKAIDMLKTVGIPSPEKRAKQYPYELSGGMRQRVMIAMALACNPALLIADEPTTALDVTIQAQILDLLKKLQTEFGTAVIMITHDLGVIWDTCDKVAVMYAGKVVEYTDIKRIFAEPRHPYTLGLLNSLPRMGSNQAELTAIPGNVPSPFAMPPGCSFAPRCPLATEVCQKTQPELMAYGMDHLVRCWNYG